MEENQRAVMTVEEMALEERKFLHELSNLLVVAHGMSSFVQQSLSDNPDAKSGDLEKMDKVIDSISKINRLVKNRRTVLHSVSVK